MTDKASKTTYLTTKTSEMTKKSKNRPKTLKTTNSKATSITNMIEIQVKMSRNYKKDENDKESTS